MSSGEDSGERNPFAPPPADAPDQPWRPRIPVGGAERPPSDTEDEDGERSQVPPPHGWSHGYRNGWLAPPQQQPQPKFDPNDPVQRRSRYALSAGFAALFCTISGLFYLSLLLGMLAVYWAVSALRAGRGAAAAGTSGDTSAGTSADAESAVAHRYAPQSAPARPTTPQAPAALGGLLTGGVALLITVAAFGATLYYQDYLTCVSDAPTQEAQASCSNLAPAWMVNLTTDTR
ncbi:hypothetical protein [Kitasatospora cinereorecta]|uniref:Integral membrane protein n=1 Tax=Kitasatospora cinereorecta TaxID=285560 RepID=A0ABW0VSM7_9ACTN